MFHFNYSASNELFDIFVIRISFESILKIFTIEMECFRNWDESVLWKKYFKIVPYSVSLWYLCRGDGTGWTRPVFDLSSGKLVGDATRRHLYTLCFTLNLCSQQSVKIILKIIINTVELITSFSYRSRFKIVMCNQKYLIKLLYNIWSFLKKYLKIRKGNYLLDIKGISYFFTTLTCFFL